MAARCTHVLIGLLAASAFAGCGGSSTHSVSGDPLAAAADATIKQPSEKVTMDAKIDLSGQSLSLEGSGAFAKQQGKLHVSFNLSGLGSSTADEIFVGDVVWISSPLLSAALNGKHWVRLDLSKPVQVYGFNLNALTGQTPTAALEKLRLKGKVSNLGAETVDGVETTHYREDLNVTEAGSRYKTVEAWVDDDDVVRKLKLDYRAQVDASGTETAHTVLTMKLSDFGTAVHIAPPAEDDVADASEVGK
jgi:hypothetical protein